jgi:Leucine-rich repeat (LRR) protein
MSSSLAACNLQSRQLLNCPAEVLLRSTVLTSLNLSRNKIVTLPRNINCLSLLKSLELDCNELEQVPHEIGYVHTLQNLSVRNNVLISIPRSFGLLSSMKSLYLSSNNITTIPPELFVNLPRCAARRVVIRPCACIHNNVFVATALKSAGSARIGSTSFPVQTPANDTMCLVCSSFG